MSKSDSLRSNETDTNSDGDSIKVFLRVRPPDDSEGLVNYGQCLDVQKPDTVILRIKAEKKVFTFDHVADPDTTQEEVFTAVGKKTIESCVKGYNGTIFAYGQTGSGKTFTMLGPSEKGDNFHHELRGVIPRSFEYLFSLVNREREKQGDKFEFLCRCSFLEIYNEQIFDLLDPASAGLNLRENMKKGVFVDGIIEQTVNSPHEAYNVLSAGWLNRRVAATSMNRESSRSHAVFTVSIETKKAGVANVKVSQLHLVDLAGSNRQNDTKTDGIRLKEAGSINKSLSTLGNVIMALADGKKRFVPYRNSKLSFLLRDSLGGNSKTFIIANVHPGAKCFGETLSTLNFARKAKMIKNEAVVNEDAQGNVSHLQAEIRRLKEELCQFQTGTIPHPLGPAAGDDINNEATVGSQNVGVSSSELRKWQTNFYNAMKLREESVKDLTDRVSQLETLCRKKDKFIQSSKMITRFRENTIAQLQKNGQMSLTEKEKSLTAEVRAMKELVEHNPMVLKYAIENKKLREEVQRLKTMEMVQSGLDFTAEQCAQLDKAFHELKENVDVTRGEAEDFRLMLQSVVKQHLEEIQRCQSRDSEQEKLVSGLQNKLVKAESLTSQLQHAIDKGCHDKQQLEERNYTLEAEVSFMEQQKRELEERLLAELTAKKQLEQETESIIQRLESESEKNSRLTQEIKEGSDSTQRLGEMNDQIGKDNESLRKTVLEQESRINQLEKEVQSNSSLKTTLEQQLAATKEAMSQILGNLQKQRTKLAEKRVEVDELGQQLLISEHEKEEVAVVLERVQMNLEEVEAHSQMAANKYEEKIRTLQDDLQEMNCQHSDLLIEMEKKETLLRSSLADCADLNQCILYLEKKLKDGEKREAMQELESLRSSQGRFMQLSESYKKVLEGLEKMREEKNKDISNLEEKLKDLEQVEKEKGQLEERIQQLQISIEEATEEGSKREGLLQEKLRALEDKVMVMTEAVGKSEELKKENKTLQEKIMKLEVNDKLLEDGMNELQQELERITSLEKSHFEEKEEMKSKLEVAMEEKSRQTKVITKLEKKNVELELENAKLVGHQNFKQKIQYHVKPKVENNELREVENSTTSSL